MASNETWKPPEIHPDPTRPLYEQFADVIRTEIASGRLRPGVRMPSVRDLAGTWRVNPNTVMRTYRDLEQIGFLMTQRGQGTFVVRDERVIEDSKLAIAKRAWQQFQEVAQSLGMTVHELIDLATQEEVDRAHE
ncbi:GntR family transcriptional regulator [Alicyclobacillus dauci]|uniref:GntR family transcriptional regulator n=1 Tax=Alicyclobacillus dauci TaxID=1475485 RepID=A0ABY6Z6J1_9BACL|nr:GntR family transcriptional regulator [Alicyclobacillus dauci]WAH38447.1 GntR family transcriptional regulator [Alicyclobacillus dauci]